MNKRGLQIRGRSQSGLDFGLFYDPDSFFCCSSAIFYAEGHRERLHKFETTNRASLGLFWKTLIGSDLKMNRSRSNLIWLLTPRNVAKSYLQTMYKRNSGKCVFDHSEIESKLDSILHIPGRPLSNTSIKCLFFKFQKKEDQSREY